MAADDLYDTAGAPEKPMVDKADAGAEQSALVAKSFCPNMAVGDRGEFEVKRILDNEMEIAYIPEAAPEESAEPAGAPEETPDMMD